MKDIKFKVVGHSLGAALAHIAAMRIKTGFLYDTLKDESAPSTIRVVTFGGMRILDDIAALEYEKRLKLEETTLRVMHRNDWAYNKIPRALGVKHVGKQVWLEDPVRKENPRKDKLTGRDVTEPHGFTAYSVALTQMMKRESEFNEDPMASEDYNPAGSFAAGCGLAVTGIFGQIMNATAKNRTHAVALKEERQAAQQMECQKARGTHKK